MLNQLKLYISAAAFACFTVGQAQAYTLSTGSVVDEAYMPAPRQSVSGITAEKWCAQMGKRLPTLQELKEMYENRNVIGGFINGYDRDGWAYWAERVNDNADGKNYGNRMIFGGGELGEKGEIQHRPFWRNSGAGAHVRCVSKFPTSKIISKLLGDDALLQKLEMNKAAFANKWCAGEYQILPTLADLLEAYKNNEIHSLVLKCDDTSSITADKWCSNTETTQPTADELQNMYNNHEIIGVFLKCNQEKEMSSQDVLTTSEPK